MNEADGIQKTILANEDQIIYSNRMRNKLKRSSTIGNSEKYKVNV